MKGRFTRLNDPFLDHYSGVFHHEGEMVTASDLNDHGLIAASRTDALGDDAIKDGVPSQGGIFTWDASNYPNVTGLREGVVYADGVRGQLQARIDPATGLPVPYTPPWDLFGKQADYPLGPQWPGAGSGPLVVFADIWTADIFAVEAPQLSDPGLHGADTSFRGRTMVQLKVAPLSERTSIETGTLHFPQIGTATIAAKAAGTMTADDPCDPCADIVKVQQRVPNALFRIEVVAVEGNADAPTKVALAWSIENASIVLTADRKAEIARAGCVYQFFSAITESRRGVFSAAADRMPSAFVGDVAVPPSPATDYNGQPWPYIRRWDGYAAFNPAAGGSAIGMPSAGFTIGGGKIVITCDAVEATLDIAGKSFVAGDYWLVELRTFAPPAGQFRVLSSGPFGIKHHYCVLVELNNGVPSPIGDPDRRKLSFPALSNVMADHVGFVDRCPKLFEGATDVQMALDNLCHISADDIAFTDDCPLYNDPTRVTNVDEALKRLCDIPAKYITFQDNCPKLFEGAKDVQTALDNLCHITAEDIPFHDACDLFTKPGVVTTVDGALKRLCTLSAADIAFSEPCDLYKGATTVQQALEKLCDAEYATAPDYRLLFDWGILCGLRARQYIDVDVFTNFIEVDGGAFMDRTGHIGESSRVVLNLDDPTTLIRHPSWASADAFHQDLAAGLVCIAVARVGTDRGSVQFYAIPKSVADGLKDTPFFTRGNAATNRFSYDAFLAKASAGEQALANRMLNAAKNWDAVSPYVAMDQPTQDAAMTFNRRMAAAFEATASPRDKSALGAMLAEIDRRYAPMAASDVLRAQYATEYFNAIAGRAAATDFNCETYWPPCPADPGDPPHYVPICCVTARYDSGVSTLYEICTFCCRKQALTPRTMNYWFGATWRGGEVARGKACCPPVTVPPLNQGAMQHGSFAVGEVLNLREQMVPGEPHPGDPVEADFSNTDIAAAPGKLRDAGLRLGAIVDVDDKARMADLLTSGILVDAQGPVTPNVGDTVTLLKRGNMVVGQVLARRVTPAEIVAPEAADGGKIVDELHAAMKSANDALTATQAQLASAKTDLATLTAARTAAKAELDGLHASLTSFQSQYTAMKADLAKSQSDLAALITASRGAHPLASLAVDPAQARNLANAGIVSVADVAGLSDDKAKALVKAGTIKEADLAKLRTSATAFLKG